MSEQEYSDKKREVRKEFEELQKSGSTLSEADLRRRLTQAFVQLNRIATRLKNPDGIPGAKRVIDDLNQILPSEYHDLKESILKGLTGDYKDK